MTSVSIEHLPGKILRIDHIVAGCIGIYLAGHAMLVDEGRRQMPDRDRTTTAVDVLLEQALELQPAINEALERAIDSVRELTLLLQAEEALRDAERTLNGRKRQLTSASSLASSRWKRSERASRGLRDLEQLSRVAADHSQTLKRVTQRRSSQGRTTPPSVDLRDIARVVALSDGQVRVQDMADEMRRRSPERYSSPRSAYAAIYDQLRRSPDFERAGPGEFVLLADRHGPQVGPQGHPMSAGGSSEASPREPDDLPFEIAEPQKRLPAQAIDDLPFE